MTFPNQHRMAIETGYEYSASWNAIHKRVRRLWGKACEYECVDCGAEFAAQWSWKHGTDPTDLMNYDPRCVKCHCAYDEWGFGKTHSGGRGLELGRRPKETKEQWVTRLKRQRDKLLYDATVEV